jgi:DNA primase
MNRANEWVDFKAVKVAVTIEMVLYHCGVTGLKKTGNELRGKCPIHRGANNKHFTVNLTKNVFKCFFAQCGAHGNVLDFVATMDQCSVRDAALKLRDWFKVGESESDSNEELEEAKTLTGVMRGIYQMKLGLCSK